MVDLKKDSHELKHYLEIPDADACMEGKQCVSLGLEVADDGRVYRQLFKSGLPPEALFKIDAKTVVAREYCKPAWPVEGIRGDVYLGLSNGHEDALPIYPENHENRYI